MSVNYRNFGKVQNESGKYKYPWMRISEINNELHFLQYWYDGKSCWWMYF